MDENGRSSRPRRQRLPIDDDLKVQLAMERFSNGLVEIRDLAIRYGRADAVVSRAIASAFRDGLVEIRRVRHREVKRSPVLEYALLRQFSFLRAAIVVDVADKRPDLSNEDLGYELANHLGQGLLRHGERILVGPGRGVYHMAEWLAKSERKLGLSYVNLISACGNLYPTHDMSRNVLLDADANVNLLSQAFQSQVGVAMTSRSIFLHESDLAWSKAYYDRLEAQPPTIALMGLGVVDHNHFLVRLTDPTESRHLPPASVPESSRQALQELIAIQQGNSGLQSSTVVEIGGRLFLIRVGASQGGPDAQLGAHVAHINSSLFVPSLENFRGIGFLVLIADGFAKANVLRLILQNRLGPDDLSLPVQAICADRSCAEELIRPDTAARPSLGATRWE